ncbi:hypothetical protein Purlil1_3969 [Purpureocillium lilacinum]|uniref:V-type proton ATPase proteolipid subunit n=2 Tax=Purpureocillium lilacinum TaxID=33203 RepID=A0ABR0C5W2_PURLI|nr:hypothetical protein Purlil1_3969 [Purpureocillium lilacinum]
MRSGAETRRVARANPRLMDPGTHWPGPGQALLQAGNSACYWGHVLSAWQQARLQQRSYGSSASSGTTSSNDSPLDASYDIDGGMPFTNQESGRAGDSLAFCTFGLNGGQQTASRGTDAAHERVPSIMYRWLQIGPRAGDLRVSYALASHWRFRLMVTAVIHSWNAFTMMSWLGGEAHSNSYRAARLAKDGNGDLGDQVQLAELQLVQLLAPPGGAGALIIRANTDSRARAPGVPSPPTTTDCISPTHPTPTHPPALRTAIRTSRRPPTADTMATELCPVYAPFFGAMGCTSAIVFTCLGASYGTAKSGVGIAAMGVLRPDLIVKNIVPVIMAGIIGIYGLVVSVLISDGLQQPLALYTGFIQFGAGLSVGLAGLAAGFAIGIVGDAGVRGTAQQPRLFVGMILILIFAEVLGLYGLIVALLMNSKATQNVTCN